MSLASVRRHLHRVEARMPPRIRAFLAREGRPLLALNRRAVARGAALGVFLGFVIPLGQVPAAVLLSPMFRANALASAAATFVTNPLTFPAIWAGAYVVGGWVLAAFASVGMVVPELHLPWLHPVPAWMPKIATGMAVFATSGALGAYHGVALWWARATQRRWRLRRTGTANATAG
jgi:uncharacterized protein (DUF2062 family)